MSNNRFCGERMPLLTRSSAIENAPYEVGGSCTTSKESVASSGKAPAGVAISAFASCDV